MTCRQLGGACEEELPAGSFEDIALQSRQIRNGDEAYIRAMNDLKSCISSPEMMEASLEDPTREVDKHPKDEQ